VTGFQFVIGDLRAQMVNMMETYIAAEPLQQARQFVIGTAHQRCRGIVPMLVGLPVCIFVLVLHVEKPDARNSGNHLYGNPNQQNGRQSDTPDGQRPERDEYRVGQVNASPLALPGMLSNKSQSEQKDVMRADEERDEGMSIDPVRKPVPLCAGQVLLDGQSYNIPDATAIQITGSRVMNGMLVRPSKIWSMDQNAADGSHPMVGG